MESTGATYSESRVDRPEREEGSDGDRNRTSAFVACGFFFMVGVVALVIAGSFYLESQADVSRQTRGKNQAITIHVADVKVAINNTAGSGEPWYEVMDVPSACTNQVMLDIDIKHGLRPSA